MFKMLPIYIPLSLRTLKRKETYNCLLSGIYLATGVVHVTKVSLNNTNPIYEDLFTLFTERQKSAE